MLTVLDFHVRLASPDHYSLDVFARGSSQPLARSAFDYPLSFLTEFALKELEPDFKDAAARINRLEQFGRSLYKKLFNEDIERVWKKHKAASEFLVLCLRIAPDARGLEALPWETLYDGEEFIAAGGKTGLTRLPLDLLPQDNLPSVELPLRMFALVSSPLDLSDNERLAMEREQEILLEAVNTPAGQGLLRVDFEDEAKLDILESDLEAGYHILHYTGHGISPEDGGGLLLEDSDGQGLPVSVTEFLGSIQKAQSTLRLAVLSGCQTARTLHAGGFRDLARGLLGKSVPAVLAMQFSISDGGGLKFAESLYKKIIEGQPLEKAMSATRRALLHDNDAITNGDALAPVLLCANGECLKAIEAVAGQASDAPKIDRAYYLGALAQLGFGFYGRRREYREIRGGLLQRNQRSVIIHGIGGIGKTALVSHAADTLYHRHRRFKGVYAFDCRSGTISPERVIFELHGYFKAQGIGELEQFVHQSIAPEVLGNFLGQLLSQWPLLVIFDNFESQLEEGETGPKIKDENLRVFLSTLVKATTAGSKFLFTSRYLFDLDEMRLGNIQSLPLGDLSRPEALNLMQKLSALSSAPFGEKLAALEKFGGHPYALVALDRYCAHQSLASAMEESASLHAQLREFLAIELNYSRLSERARELLNRFAAFRRPESLAAVDWVMGEKVPYPQEFLDSCLDLLDRSTLSDQAKEMDDRELLAALEVRLPERRLTQNLDQAIKELIDWGLLVPTREDGQMTALSAHALVRDFCRDKQGETWRIHLRDAAAFYTNLTKLVKDDEKSQAAVSGEMEAFELLIEARDFGVSARLIETASTLLFRWGFGRYLESQYRRLMGKLDDEGTANVLHNYGYLLQSRGEYEMALEQYERSLAIREKLQDRWGAASSMLHIGIIHHERGEYEAALEQYQRAVSLKEEFGDRAGVARGLHQMAMIREHQGEYQTALEQYRRSLSIFEELGDREGVAGSLHHIGTTHQRRGEYAAALEHYQRSLAIGEELGDRASVAQSLHQMGMINQDRGEHEAALEYYQRSLAIEEELGDLAGVASTRAQIGTLCTASGRYPEAFQLLVQGFAVFMRLRSPDAHRVANALKELRSKWGEEPFDAAWREATGEDLPDWLR
jgi:tetratricopeptide (TPR) repeat protein/CHAT domain-containing protein